MKENYDVYQIRMPKGRKAEIKAHADSRGESMNAFIGRAIDEKQWSVTRKEVNRVGTEKERKDAQKAVLYDLRRLIKNSEKENYTKEELCDWLDTIADAKDQE